MPPPPNLLFIFTDEQRMDTLAAYGNTRISMPNLNRFAETCTVFKQTYVTQPVCTPSRSSLLTGLYPHTSGMTENNLTLRIDIPCLPEMITNGQYTTAYYGKWHLGDEIFAQHGFDEFRSVEDLYNMHFTEGRDKEALSTYHSFLINHGLTPKKGRTFGREEACQLPEELGKPAYLANEAIDFLQKHRSDPFILYVNFLEPHMPFSGPRDGQYNPAEIPLPPNFENIPDENDHLKHRLFHHHYTAKGCGGSPSLNNEQAWRELIARYWGLCSLVDTHVGRILQTVEDLGLEENTIIVFTSDHGDMMGSHQLVAKCVMYEEATRVPLMIHLPGQTSQHIISSAISQIDVVPTLLDCLEQPIPPSLEGKSLKSALLTPELSIDDDVFIEWNGPNSGISADVVNTVLLPEHLLSYATTDEANAAILDPLRTIITQDGWKYTHSTLGMHSLYNLHDDPYEKFNLAHNPDKMPLMADLLRRIQKWQIQHNDSVIKG